MKNSVDNTKRCGMMTLEIFPMESFMSTEDKARIAVARSNYYKTHKAAFAHYSARARDQIKQEMIEAYGSCCAGCGETRAAVLSLDHKNDDAQIEKELYGLNARGGHKHYWRLKREGWPKDRFQLLCFNCNAEKEHTRRRTGMTENWGEEKEVFSVPKRACEGPRATNKSGFKGVFWNGQKKCWQAKITVNHACRGLGLFKDVADAARAYKRAAQEAWGEHANVPSEEEIIEISARTVEPVELKNLVATSNPEDMGL